MNPSSTDEAYKDGIEAAHRIGKYEGVDEVPPCPYADGTLENKAWWAGFGDGTEDLIAYQRGDF